MIDILYLAKGRPEFTGASLRALAQSRSNWGGISLVLYTDGAALPGYLSWPERANPDTYIEPHHYGGPVAIMNHFLSRPGSDLFIKLDNDVIVPPGWLNQCLDVMEAHPELDLLGIEPPASRTPAPWATGKPVPTPELARYCLSGKKWEQGYAPCDSIGGIGMMRRSAFANRKPMEPHGPNGVGGFTDWQLAHPEVKKGWIVPPLKLFLLDRLPVEPWASLSKRYIAEGIQRPWTNYPESASHLWEWWRP